MPLPWGGSILAAVEKMEREYAEKRQRTHVDAAAPTQGFENCSANLTIDDVLGSRSTPCDWYEPRLSKEDWFEESAKLYDLDVGAITDRVRSEESEESRLSVHVCGSWGQGYAAILRDSQLVPIAAMCKPDSSGVSKSIFCTGLMAVALGVKVASKYQVLQLTFYVPSRYLCNFLVSIWNPYGEYFSSPHPKGKQWKSLLEEDDKVHIEQICQLASSIIFDLNKLRSRGMNYFAVQTVRPRRNKAAQFLANLGEDKDMKFAEIRAHEGLSEILYEDAFF